jgi:ACS family glucarate transporter-like MFS transporter
MTPIPESRIRWLLVFWIFVMSAITYLDRVNISISGRWLAQEFHFSDIQLGWIFSAFVVGYALFQVPAGRLADRFGPRRVLAGGALWWGAFTVLTALVPVGVSRDPVRAGRAALLCFLAVRFMLGAGEAVIYPSSNRFVANWIPTGERGMANGLIFAGVGGGAAATPPLITAIMVRYGWRMSFWVCAAIGGAAGLVWFWLARDDPEQHPGVSAAELEHIRAGLTSRASVGPNGPPPVGSGPQGGVRPRGELRSPPPWSTVLRSKEVVAATFSYFCYGYAAFMFFSWFFIYLLKGRGMDLKRSAFYSMLPFAAMAICSPLGGMIADLVSRRWGRRVGRCGVAALGMGLAAVFIALGSTTTGAGAATLVLACGVGALYLAQSSFWAVTADIAGPSAGTVSGLVNMGAQTGGALTASLTPLIAARFGWTASFLAASALCALGAATWFLVDPEQIIADG